MSSDEFDQLWMVVSLLPGVYSSGHTLYMQGRPDALLVRGLLDNLVRDPSTNLWTLMSRISFDAALEDTTRRYTEIKEQPDV